MSPGVGRAPLAELDRRVGQAGYSVVRWITAADNATAQRLYGKVAQRNRLGRLRLHACGSRSSG